MMKILLVHQYYKTPETGGALRSYYLSKYFAKNGHEVTVITAYNGKRYTTERPFQNITVHYLPVYYTNHLSFLSRLHAFFRFVWQTLRLAGKLEVHQLNYVISTPLTTGLIALYLKKKNKTPYIFEVGDLWPEAPIQLKIIRNKILKTLAYWLEKTIYNQAKGIIALSTDIAEVITSKTKTNVEVVTNFADIEYFNLEEKAFNPGGPFTIGYIGTLGMANHLEYLLAVAKVSLPYPQLSFLIMGNGAQHERIKRLSDEWGLHNVEFVLPGDKENVKETMQRIQAVYVSFKNVPVLSTGSPNKLFDGLAAGKLIIVNCGGWIRRCVEKYKCGFYHDPEDPNQFITAVMHYLKDPKKLQDAQRNARRLAEEKFSVSTQCERALRFMER